MASKARLVLDTKALDAMLGAPQTAAEVHAVADAVAGLARGFAAKDTGAGAASIAARPSRRRRASYVVSWDKAHRYMIYPEVGTRFMEAQPALGPALDAYAHF
jgi:HK97 gp10 family phage protein